jgi:ribose transport system ATP-binding protein
VQLDATSLAKQYPGVLALDDVSISIQSGEVHAVAGENGAGKSTLMHILAGAVAPDRGHLEIDGAPIRFRSPRAARAAGIRMIHQELNLVPDLSVAENIFLGVEPTRGAGRFGLLDRRRQSRDARAVLDRLGQIALSTEAAVRDLSLAARQMTEIAKAVAANARALIMDEPTAILAQDDANALFAVIAHLRAEGVAIVYISHRLDEIFRIADRVTVLRDGRHVATNPISAVTRAELVRQMVGRDLAAGYPGATVSAGDEMLRVEHLSSGPVVDASFSLRHGEIVGVVGLVGSGRTELARAVYGAARVTAGTMTLNGKSYAPGDPRDAIMRGVALLPEDRKRQGLVLIAAIRDNVSLSSLGALARRGVIDAARERESVERWTAALSVKTPSIERPVRQLSGGNQQKIVLARWMLANARLLLFDEPTRGIDVGAKAEIYQLMRRLAAQGAGILMISSDLPEALGMADRLIVMREGRIVGQLSRAEATQQRVAELTLGERAGISAA